MSKPTLPLRPLVNMIRDDFIHGAPMELINNHTQQYLLHYVEESFQYPKYEILSNLAHEANPKRLVARGWTYNPKTKRLYLISAEWVKMSWVSFFDLSDIEVTDIPEDETIDYVLEYL